MATSPEVVSVAVPVPRVTIRGSWRQREGAQGFIWVLPAFLYLALFIAYPFFMAVYLSVSRAWHHLFPIESRVTG